MIRSSNRCRLKIALVGGLILMVTFAGLGVPVSKWIRMTMWFSRQSDPKGSPRMASGRPARALSNPSRDETDRRTRGSPRPRVDAHQVSLRLYDLDLADSRIEGVVEGEAAADPLDRRQRVEVLRVLRREEPRALQHRGGEDLRHLGTARLRDPADLQAAGHRRIRQHRMLGCAVADHPLRAGVDNRRRPDERAVGDHQVDLVGVGVPAHPAVAAAVIGLEHLRRRGLERGLASRR